MTLLLHKVAEFLGDGETAQHLSVLQVSLRAVIIFVATLTLVRLADKRFIAKHTAFDVLLGFVLASTMARAINGGERLGPTMVAGLVLALLHRFMGALAYRWHAFGHLVKGSTTIIIRDGQVDQAALRRHHLAQDDLEEELRLKGVQHRQEVHLATLERSGEVSVIRKE